MNHWNSTRHALPPRSARVEFLLSGRHVPLIGTFEGDCFRSRWACYVAPTVRLWRRQPRGLAQTPAHAAH